MSKKELKKLSALLSKDKKRLEKQLKKLSKVDFGDDIDSGEEESDEVEEKVNNLATARVLEGRLIGINGALEKIEAGTYGMCERCNKEISFEMLSIDPESRLCKECKQAHGQNAL